MTIQSRFVAVGALFGFVLSRAGATDFDTIFHMFLLEDLHLFGVMGTAVVATFLAFRWIRARGLRSASGEPMKIHAKPMKPGLVAAAALFGVGWAVSGTCPGTALAQIGEGKAAGLVVFAGLLLGVSLYAWKQRNDKKAPEAPGPRATPHTSTTL